MYKLLMILIVYCSLLFADTAVVNCMPYENSTIYLCDKNLNCDSNEYRFIDTKGYGLFCISIQGMVTNKTCYGIWGGSSYGLAINSSFNLQYARQIESWYSNSIPSELIKVPHADSYIGVYNGGFNENFDTTVSTIFGICFLPFNESGSWSLDGGPMNNKYWFTTFGNVGEIFYLSRAGENTIKFQIHKITAEPMYTICFASDSLCNGKFKISGTPIIHPVSDNVKQVSQNIRFINNKLYFPHSLNSGHISIFNIRGQKILSLKLDGNSLEMDCLPSGVYQYLIAGAGRNCRGSFIIK